MQIQLGIKRFDSPLSPHDASEEARRLLFEMLTESGLPTAISLKKDKNGRPYADHPSEARIFDFNLSHAGNYVACALAIAEQAGEAPRVGVDVEIPHPRMSKERLAERFFSASERERLEKRAYCDSDFLDIWTKKEAYLKYTGTGLSGGMRETDTEHPETLAHAVSLTSYRIPSDPSACVALCLPKGIPAPLEARLR